MEIFLLLSLLIAGGATAAIYKNPAARAVADGAWRAGRDQARREAVHGWEVSRHRYHDVQAYLRRPVVRADGTVHDPGPLNLRWWLSGAAAVTAGAATGAAGGAYAAGCAAFAGGRTIRAAVQGGRQAARDRKDDVVDGKVVADDAPGDALTSDQQATPAEPHADAGERPPETPGAETVPGQPIKEDNVEDQLIQGAGDKLSHTQLKSALARVGKLLGRGAGELDTVIAGLQADQLDQDTIQGLRELQEMLGTLSAKCSTLRNHVQTTDGVAEAINAVGAQNVAKTEHYAEA